MIDLSVVTTMTNPEDRNDPWKEALDCYNQIADELVVVGEDWPYEFKFDYMIVFYHYKTNKTNKNKAS